MMIDIRFLTIVMLSLSIWALVDVSSEPLQLAKQPQQQAGFLKFTVTGDDFAAASESTPMYLRISTLGDFGFCQNLVDSRPSSSDPRSMALAVFTSPVVEGYNIHVPVDAVTIVRAIADEQSIWVKVKASSSTWIEAPGGIFQAPTLDHPVAFVIGDSALDEINAHSSSANPAHGGSPYPLYSNQSSNTKSPGSSSFSDVYSTHNCLCLLEASLNHGDTIKFVVQFYDHLTSGVEDAMQEADINLGNPLPIVVNPDVTVGFVNTDPIQVDAIVGPQEHLSKGMQRVRLTPDGMVELREVTIAISVDWLWGFEPGSQLGIVPPQGLYFPVQLDSQGNPIVLVSGSVTYYFIANMDIAVNGFEDSSLALALDADVFQAEGLWFSRGAILFCYPRNNQPQTNQIEIVTDVFMNPSEKFEAIDFSISAFADQYGYPYSGNFESHQASNCVGIYGFGLTVVSHGVVEAFHQAVWPQHDLLSLATGPSPHRIWLEKLLPGIQEFELSIPGSEWLESFDTDSDTVLDLMPDPPGFLVQRLSNRGGFPFLATDRVAVDGGTRSSDEHSHRGVYLLHDPGQNPHEIALFNAGHDLRRFEIQAWNDVGDVWEAGPYFLGPGYQLAFDVTTIDWTTGNPGAFGPGDYRLSLDCPDGVLFQGLAQTLDGVAIVDQEWSASEQFQNAHHIFGITGFSQFAAELSFEVYRPPDAMPGSWDLTITVTEGDGDRFEGMVQVDAMERLVLGVNGPDLEVRVGPTGFPLAAVDSDSNPLDESLHVTLTSDQVFDLGPRIRFDDTGQASFLATTKGSGSDYRQWVALDGSLPGARLDLVNLASAGNSTRFFIFEPSGTMTRRSRYLAPRETHRVIDPLLSHGPVWILAEASSGDIQMIAADDETRFGQRQAVEVVRFDPPPQVGSDRVEIRSLWPNMNLKLVNSLYPEPETICFQTDGLGYAEVQIPTPIADGRRLTLYAGCTSDYAGRLARVEVGPASVSLGQDRVVQAGDSVTLTYSSAGQLGSQTELPHWRTKGVLVGSDPQLTLTPEEGVTVTLDVVFPGIGQAHDRIRVHVVEWPQHLHRNLSRWPVPFDVGELIGIVSTQAPTSP